jgi:outer membrane protein TolC
MKFLNLCTLLPVLAVNLWAAAPTAPELSLPEAIFPDLEVILKKAAQQSPQMLSQALTLEIAEQGRISARSSLLPSIGASVSLSRGEDKTTYIYSPQSSYSTDYYTTTNPYSYSISQPVFHWGALRNSARIGAIYAKIAHGQYRNGYRLLAQSLRASYQSLIVQKIAVKRAALYLEIVQKQLAIHEAGFAQKEIAEATVVNSRLAVEAAQIDYERVQFNFEAAKNFLARLSGCPALDHETIPDGVPKLIYTEAAFSQLLAGFLAQKDLPTMEAVTARKNLEIANLNYAITRTRLLPKFGASAGVSQSVQHNLYGSIDTYQLNSRSVSISASWSIFDGFASGAAQRSALATRRQQEAAYKELTDQLAQSAQTQVKLINFYARSMSMSDRALVASGDNLKHQQAEFARGNIAEAALSWAQMGLYDAQMSTYSVRNEYLRQTGEFLGLIVEDPVLNNLTDK